MYGNYHQQQQHRSFVRKTRCQVVLNFSPLADLFVARCKLQSAQSGTGSTCPNRVIDRVRCCSLSAARRKAARGKKKQTTLQHVPNKFKRLWNSAGGRGQPIPPWRWWMASTRNGRKCHGRCLFILQQERPVALVHSWTDSDCAASTCVAAFIIAGFDVCANLPGLHKISDIHLNPYEPWSFCRTKGDWESRRWCRYSC